MAAPCYSQFSDQSKYISCLDQTFYDQNSCPESLFFTLIKKYFLFTLFYFLFMLNFLLKIFFSKKHFTLMFVKGNRQFLTTFILLLWSLKQVITEILRYLSQTNPPNSPISFQRTYTYMFAVKRRRPMYVRTFGRGRDDILRF